MSDLVPIIAAVVGTGAFTALIQGAYGRRKMAADAESVQVQNALALVEPYRNQVVDMRRETSERLLELRSEIEHVRERNVELRTELRAARQEIGQLMRREREAIQWRAEMIGHVKLMQELAHAEGVDLPAPPDPPRPVRERTRASDRDAPDAWLTDSRSHNEMDDEEGK